MKTLAITVDLNIRKEDGSIQVRSNDAEVTVNVSSSEAVVLPIRKLLAIKKYIKLSKHLSQTVLVNLSGKKLLSIHNGSVKYHSRWILIVFLFKSLFAKGL